MWEKARVWPFVHRTSLWMVINTIVLIGSRILSCVSFISSTLHSFRSDDSMRNLYILSLLSLSNANCSYELEIIMCLRFMCTTFILCNVRIISLEALSVGCIIRGKLYWPYSMSTNCNWWCSCWKLKMNFNEAMIRLIWTLECVRHASSSNSLGGLFLKCAVQHIQVVPSNDFLC